jgi:hypothetical protein
VLGEEGDVVRPVAEGRHVEGDDVEAVVEVAAEGAAAHLLLQVTVGGGDDAHVGLDGPGGAHGHDLPLLEGAEQLDLEGGRHLADLVQEEGAAAGGHQEAVLVPDGAGEGSLHVAEELGLQQALGEGAAVDGDEGAVGAVGEAVDVAGQDLLAGAALAGDEDGGVGGGDGLGEADDLEEGAVLPDGPALARGVAALDLLLEGHVLVLELAGLGGAAAEGDEVVVGEGFLEVVEGAAVDGLDGGLEGGLGGHEDDGDLGVPIPDGGQDVHAGDAGHADVGDDDVRRPSSQRLQGLFPLVRDRHLEPLAAEEDLQGVEDGGLVVDDQDSLWLMAPSRRRRGGRR